MNGSLVPWSDPALSAKALQDSLQITRRLKSQFASASHSRRIVCREYFAEQKRYNIAEIPTTCAISSLCNGIPSVDAIRDGEIIDLNSSIGNYIKQTEKISDASNWECSIVTR